MHQEIGRLLACIQGRRSCYEVQEAQATSGMRQLSALKPLLSRCFSFLICIVNHPTRIAASPDTTTEIFLHQLIV
jgi:hypothetical protein